MARWHDVVADLLEFAADDLASSGEVAPVLAGFRGDAERVLAWLRPFGKGAYHAPVRELLELAVPLGCDRYATLFGGRAWSRDDPIPPVADGVDLRQRVATITLVDGADRTREPTHRNHLVPFDVVGGDVRWGDPRVIDGAPEGWIPDALDAAARGADAGPARPERLRARAERCISAGHDLYLAPDVIALLRAIPPLPDRHPRPGPRRARPPRPAWRGSACR